MHMLGHHHMLADLYHGIMGRNTRGQLLLYHSSDGCQFHPWRMGRAIRFAGITDHSSQRSSEFFTYVYRHMVIAGRAVIVMIAAPIHAVLADLISLFHFDTMFFVSGIQDYYKQK